MEKLFGIIFGILMLTSCNMTTEYEYEHAYDYSGVVIDKFAVGTNEISNDVYYYVIVQSIDTIPKYVEYRVDITKYYDTGIGDTLNFKYNDRRKIVFNK